MYQNLIYKLPEMPKIVPQLAKLISEKQLPLPDVKDGMALKLAVYAGEHGFGVEMK